MLWNVTFHLPLAGLWVRVIGWACFWPVKKVDLLGLVAARNQAAGAGKADSLKVKVKSSQSCPTLCNPTDCSLPGSSVHGIFQARVLEWVAISFSRGTSRSRDRTLVSCLADR